MNFFKVIALILLANGINSSYGMTDGESNFDSTIGLNLLGPATLLPHLETQQTLLENGTVSLASEQEYLIGQSLFKRLPTRIWSNIIRKLFDSERVNFALTCQACRHQVQLSMTHLTIPVSDITQEKLKNVKCKFTNVKSLRIISKAHQNTEQPPDRPTPSQIELLAECFPTIESLNLSHTYLTLEGVEALVRSRMLNSLKELDLSGNKDIGNTGIATLVKVPSFVSQLISLNLSRTGITVEGIKSLSSCNKFTSIKKLDLSHNEIKDKGIAELVKAPFAAQLEHLCLNYSLMTKEGVQSLSQPTTFVALKDLKLSYNKIGDESIEFLIEAPFATILKSLELRDTDTTSLGVKTLSRGKFDKLRKLHLSHNTLGDEGLAQLSISSFAKQIESIDLRNVGITVLGVEALSGQHFTSLKELVLDNNNISDEGIAKLSEAPFAGQLELLELRRCNIKTGGFKTLSLPGKFIALKKIYISANHAGAEGVEALIKAPFIEQLEVLDLSNNDVREEGAKQLFCKSNFKKLKELYIRSNKIGDQGITYLINSPLLSILNELDLSDNCVRPPGREASKQVNLSHYGRNTISR